MTKANKKRVKRGDPIKYKDHVGNSKIFYYTLDDKDLFRPRKEKLSRDKAAIYKKYYLKAVKKLRKENPDMSYDDHKIWQAMINLEFNDRIKGKIKGDW